MTPFKQRLVRKKNRKLRRLGELYPDIRIKLFYARDFRAMLLKYGRIGLVESLSGTSRQVVPDRAAEAADALPAPPGRLVPARAAGAPDPTDRDPAAAKLAAATAVAAGPAGSGVAGP